MSEQPQIFTKAFKELVLASLVQDRRFLQTAAANLRSEHFDDTIHCKAVDIIFQTYSKTNEPPSKVGLLTELINALSQAYRTKSDDQQEKLAVKPAQDFVEQIYKPIHGNIEDVKEKFLEYIRVQELKTAALQAYLGLEQGSMSWTEASETFRRADRQSNSRTKQQGIRVFGVSEQIKSQFQENSKPRYSTGFSVIDKAMYGGPGPGTLTLFIAEAKGGKSMLLLQVAEANVRKGKKVLVITLEIDAQEWRRRFLSRVTNIKYEELPLKIDEVNAKLESYSRANKGEIIITRFDAYTNCNDFRSYIYALESQENFKPDVIIIDYGDLVRSCFRKASDKQYEHEDAAFIEIRNMMNEFSAAGFTASQSNREAMEKENVRMKDGAGSIGKIRHSDHIITWAQSPIQKDIHEGFLAFVGTREGRSGIRVKLKTDFERCSMIQKPKQFEISKPDETKIEPPEPPQKDYKWED